MRVHAHASVNIYRWKSTAWIGTWSQLNFEDFWRTYIFHIYRFLSEQIHNHLLKHWLNEMEVQINEHTCWILCSSVDVGEKHMILLAIWHCFRIYVTMLVPCLGQFTDVVGMYSAMIQCSCQIYFVILFDLVSIIHRTGVSTSWTRPSPLKFMLSLEIISQAQNEKLVRTKRIALPPIHINCLI